MKAEELFHYFKKGEFITVETRQKTYTGAFGGLSDDKIMVGLDFVPTSNISQDILDRINPELMIFQKQQYIKNNYFEPKKVAEESYKKSQDDYVKEQKANIVKGIILEKKLLEEYPFWSNSTP